jgi:hypothetical protein
MQATGEPAIKRPSKYCPDGVACSLGQAGAGLIRSGSLSAKPDDPDWRKSLRPPAVQPKDELWRYSAPVALATSILTPGPMVEEMPTFFT